MKCQINNQLKPDNPQHKPGSPWENWSLPTTSQLHLFCTAWSLRGKRAKVVILMQPHLLSRCGPKQDRRQTQLGRTLVARWQYNFNSGILASGKTRMAPKKSKFTAAWWLASNLTDVPLFMKCQTNNQKTHIIPNRNLDRLGKTGRCHYLQLCSFTPFALHDLYSGSCAKVVILIQLPFAVEMWDHMGQITNTAWKNTCGTLAVQLQQWDLREWQD